VAPTSVPEAPSTAARLRPPPYLDQASLPLPLQQQPLVHLVPAPRPAAGGAPGTGEPGPVPRAIHWPEQRLPPAQLQVERLEQENQALSGALQAMQHQLDEFQAALRQLRQQEQLQKLGSAPAAEGGATSAPAPAGEEGAGPGVAVDALVGRLRGMLPAADAGAQAAVDELLQAIQAGLAERRALKQQGQLLLKLASGQPLPC